MPPKHALPFKLALSIIGIAAATCLSAALILFFLDHYPERGSGNNNNGDVSSPARRECLRQENFPGGTLTIDEPGTYALCENIIFDPFPPVGSQSPAEAFDALLEGVHDRYSFQLGYFAAIAVTANNVDIHLNGFTLEQSPAHALMQRFFALIELANSPFVPNTGPAMFVGPEEVFRAASNLRILGPGTLGRSSHHSIHGNENSNILIRDVTFRDFEVAAVSLNNVDNLRIQDCQVLRNRQDVPVSGMFSAARFLRPYGAYLKEIGFEMTLRGQRTTASDLYDSLLDSINVVFEDVVHGGEGQIDPVAHPVEYALYDNRFKVVDGPCYAFLIHGQGPAVGGQGFVFDSNTSLTSSNILIENNEISNIKCWNKEIPAAVVNGTVQNDVRGAVFQWIDTSNQAGMVINEDGTYRGNVVADMQLMVAKAIHEGVLGDSTDDVLPTAVNTIHPSVVEWAESPNVTFAPMYRCNGDSMHHVVKGIVVIRVEDTRGFEIRNNTIREVENLSLAPFSPCFDFHPGASEENAAQQQMSHVRAISVAATRPFYQSLPSALTGNRITNVDSVHSHVVIGIDLQGDSGGIELRKNHVNLQEGVGPDLSDRFVALRVRSHVDGSSLTLDPDNEWVQEVENQAAVRRLRRSSLPVDHPPTEWAYGGCPFSRGGGIPLTA